MRISVWSSYVCSSDLGAIFDSEAVDATGTGFANDTARAPGHFRHDVGAEALDDLVESPGNRRQRGERLDQAVTTRNGVPALHGLAVAKHGSRRQVAFAVREGLVELHREGMSEVVQNVFARSEEHTSELQSLMRISYAVFCLKKKHHKTYIELLTQK